jgi:hypothetical protein
LFLKSRCSATRQALLQRYVLQKERRFVTGHDFSRAENAAKMKVGFSPEGMLL